MSGRRAFWRVLVCMVAVLVGVAPGTSAQPSPDPAERIVVGITLPTWVPLPFFTISNMRAVPFLPPGARPELASQLVYNGLYRLDASMDAVPDLAAEPCVVAADAVTISCRLVETTFHDGSPLTADDVAFTYELGLQDPACLREPFSGLCLGSQIESVVALDDRTVQFRLVKPDATFLSVTLATVMIESRAVVEDAFAAIAERAPQLDAAKFVRAADDIDAQFELAEPDCLASLEAGAALLASAGVEPLPAHQFHGPDGSIDHCMQAQWTAILLRAIGASLGATGLAAIAAAYQALSFNRAPIGTGPYRFLGADGPRALFEAFDGYHHGRPATRQIDLRIHRDPVEGVEAMRTGELHWFPIPLFAPELRFQLDDLPNVRIATFAERAYVMLAYNLRDGMLFADRDLRRAVELCIDKPATVDAATDGGGEVLYGPISPISWAYETDLPRPARDVAAARGLIEGAGWTEGPDGVYVRNGRRLSAEIFVNASDSQRIEFFDLVSAQTRACGMELTVVPADRETALAPLEEYPHVPGGYDRPFEAMSLGWIQEFDPHDPLWHSRSMTSAENPVDFNFMGFSDPRVDELIDQGLASSDQRERARIYRELQRIIADESPVLFGWADRVHEALDTRLGMVDGELELTSRFWPWQLEKLVLLDE